MTIKNNHKILINYVSDKKEQFVKIQKQKK